MPGDDMPHRRHRLDKHIAVADAIDKTLPQPVIFILLKCQDDLVNLLLRPMTPNKIIHCSQPRYTHLQAALLRQPL